MTDVKSLWYVPKNARGGYRCAVELVVTKDGYVGYLRLAKGDGEPGDIEDFQLLLGKDYGDCRPWFPFWIGKVQIHGDLVPGIRLCFYLGDKKVDGRKMTLPEVELFLGGTAFVRA